MERWSDDAEHVEDDGPHGVGFANLYHGEVYGECMCGWSTTLRDPDPDLAIVREQVAEAQARVIRHCEETMRAVPPAPVPDPEPPRPRRWRRSLRAGGRVKGEPSGSSRSDAQRP